MRYVIAVLFVAGVFVVLDATGADPSQAVRIGWGILSGVILFGVDAVVFVVTSLTGLLA